MSPKKMRARGSPKPQATGGQAEPQQQPRVTQPSALGDDGPMLIEDPVAHPRAHRAPAVLDPTPPPGVAAEGGPTTHLTSTDLPPRWIDHPYVDSPAMLSAFLAYRGRCTGEAYTQLGDIDMIVHDHAPTVGWAAMSSDPR